MNIDKDTDGVLDIFPTGSRVYGSPRVDSDRDVVVLCTPRLAQVLREALKTHPNVCKAVSGGPGSVSLMDSDTNFIVLTDPEQRDAWKRGTLRCMALAPVSRDVAVRIMKQAGVK